MDNGEKLKTELENWVKKVAATYQAEYGWVDLSAMVDDVNDIIYKWFR